MNHYVLSHFEKKRRCCIVSGSAWKIQNTTSRQSTYLQISSLSFFATMLSKNAEVCISSVIQSARCAKWWIFQLLPDITPIHRVSIEKHKYLQARTHVHRYQACVKYQKTRTRQSIPHIVPSLWCLRVPRRARYVWLNIYYAVHKHLEFLKNCATDLYTYML